MASPWEKYQQPASAAPEVGPWMKYQAALPSEAQPAPEAPSLMQRAGQTIGNMAAGAVRGAGSIGATILTPVDAAARAVGIENDFIGRSDRREAMDAGLAEMGADPASLAFRSAKVGAEIAGTAGAGGVLAKGAQAVGAAAPVVQGLASGGLNV